MSDAKITVASTKSIYDADEILWRVVGEYVDDGVTRVIPITPEGMEYVSEIRAEEIASCMREVVRGGASIADLLQNIWTVTRVGTEQITTGYDTFEDAIWDACTRVYPRVESAAEKCVSLEEIKYEDSRDYTISSKDGRNVFVGTYGAKIRSTEIDYVQEMVRRNAIRAHLGLPKGAPIPEGELSEFRVPEEEGPEP